MLDESAARTNAFRAGTLAGAGSFRCDRCDFAVALHEQDPLPRCPHCGSEEFRRSSLFGDPRAAEPWIGGKPQTPDWLGELRETLVGDGDYLAYRDDEGVHAVPIEEGWTRVGRSMAAHLRFDDPTVSRRHALVHRDEDRVRVLDDRSLNGLFVNGERVEWHDLKDGDEIVVGRFRIYFVSFMGGVGRGPNDRVGNAVS